MINYETILSNYEDKLTLMQWLDKVEAALKDATATGFHVTKTGNATLTFSIDFDDGTTLTSEELTLNQGESVASAAIVNGVLELTLTNGDVLSAGNIFNGNVNITGDLSVSGDAAIAGAATASSFTAPSVKATGTGLETDVIKNINGDIDIFANEVDFNGNIQAQGDIETLGDIKTDYLNSDSTEISAKKPVVEVMTGYSAVVHSDMATWAFVLAYCGIVKNGNKLTLAASFKLTPPNGYEEQPTAIEFTIPASIGTLLNTITIGGYGYLDQKVIAAFSSPNDFVNVPVRLGKLTNARLPLIIRADNHFVAGTEYVIRYEVTFLLSNSLI